MKKLINPPDKPVGFRIEEAFLTFATPGINPPA